MPLISAFAQLPVLMPANLIDRFAQFLGTVELVVDYLSLRSMLGGRLHKGLPHVHRDRFDLAAGCFPGAFHSSAADCLVRPSLTSSTRPPSMSLITEM